MAYLYCLVYFMNQKAHRMKARSLSMPTLKVLGKGTKKLQPIYGLQSVHSRELRLQQIQNKQAEDLRVKLKLMQERSMKKLEQRYGTIDKWKQKYIPDYNDVITYKHTAKLAIDCIQSPQQAHFEQQVVAQKGLFPIIDSKSANSRHMVQQKRLENAVMARLQRNRKKDQARASLAQKQINYFDAFYIHVPAQKRRQLQLKKLFLKAQKQRIKNEGKGFFYIKMPLSDPRLKKKHRDLQPLSPQQRKPKKMVQVKQLTPSLLVDRYQQQSPQAWHINDDPGELDMQQMSEDYMS